MEDEGRPLTASVGTSSDAGFRYGLGISTSLLRKPRVGGWQFRSDRLVHHGAAAARVFLDHDLDGQFSEGDEALEGIHLEVGGRSSPSASDANGFVHLTGLRSYRRLDLGLSERSLGDPFLVPAREGVSFIPRPGVTVPIDFPIHTTSELDGTIFLRKGPAKIEVSNVSIRLLNAEGKQVQKVRSAFDGFYLIDGVLPGRYQLEVDPVQLRNLGLKPSPSLEIVVESGEVLNGLDVVLEQSESSVEDAEYEGAMEVTTERKAARLWPESPPESFAVSREGGQVSFEREAQETTYPATKASLPPPKPTTATPPSSISLGPKSTCHQGDSEDLRTSNGVLQPREQRPRVSPRAT